MKRSLAAIVMILSLVSCSAWQSKAKRNLASVSDEEMQQVSPEYQEILYKFNDFNNLIEETLVWRAKSVKFSKELEEAIASGRPLTSKEVKYLHLGTNVYMDLRESLWEAINENAWMAGDKTEVEITKGPTTVTEESPWYTFGFGEKKKIVKINLHDAKGQVYTTKFLMAFTAGTLLYDNFLLAISKFDELEKVRRLIDYDNADLDDSLERIRESAVDFDNHDLMMKTLDMYKYLKGSDAKLDLYQQYLSDFIERSYIYNNVKKYTKAEVLKDRIKKRFRAFSDSGDFLLKETTNEVSKIFGNTAGLVQTRDGKLYNMSTSKVNRLTAQLKPLDILLEKTPFRLTDKFIPGHWGHVAIWIGTEPELKRLGIWDHELVRKYHKEIREGRSIVEALRPGVEMNTMKHFLQVDDLAAIRFKDLTKEQTVRYILSALEQVGKEYDFNFDVESDEKIVCSELAYVVYDDFDWPTQETMGRYTISPDHVADLVGTGEMTTAVLYHDGKKIHRDLDVNFDYLMKKEYEKVYFK